MLKEGRFRLDIKKTFAHRGSRRSIRGNIQGQVEWGSEQPDLVEVGLVRCKGFGPDDYVPSYPNHPVILFTLPCSVASYS